MPFRGTGLVQARGCNVERTGSGEEEGAECRCARGREGSRPKRGRKGVVGQRGREGFGVLNHRAGARLPPVYCRIKRSDCYVMDHLYASTLNSALRSSLSLSLALSRSDWDLYRSENSPRARSYTRTRNCPLVRRPSRKFPKFVFAWRAMVMAKRLQIFIGYQLHSPLDAACILFCRLNAQDRSFYSSNCSFIFLHEISNWTLGKIFFIFAFIITT